VLVDSPYDEGAIAEIAAAHERYVVLHQYASSIAVDHTTASIAEERRTVRATLKAAHTEATDELKERLERRRRQMGRLEKRVEKQKARIAQQNKRRNQMRAENQRLRGELEVANARWIRLPRLPWRH
jgi:chromosome segregation ATPase